MLPPSFDTLTQDVRYALRGLKKSTGFAVVAILSLALGLGANIAIFSLVNAVILKYLPVERPEELVQLQYTFPESSTASSTFGNPAWEQVRDRHDIFAEVFAWSNNGSAQLTSRLRAFRQSSLFPRTLRRTNVNISPRSQ